jgi:hypothetical protein
MMVAEKRFNCLYGDCGAAPSFCQVPVKPDQYFLPVKGYGHCFEKGIGGMAPVVRDANEAVVKKLPADPIKGCP